MQSVGGSTALRTIGGLDAIEEAAAAIAHDMGNGATPRRRKSLLKSEQLTQSSSVLVNTKIAATMSPIVASRKRSFVEKSSSDANRASKNNLASLAGEASEDHHGTSNPSVADIGTSDSSKVESPGPAPSRKKSNARSSFDGIIAHRLSRTAITDMLTPEELQDEVGW